MCKLCCIGNSSAKLLIKRSKRSFLKLRQIKASDLNFCISAKTLELRDSWTGDLSPFGNWETLVSWVPTSTEFMISTQTKSWEMRSASCSPPTQRTSQLTKWLMSGRQNWKIDCLQCAVNSCKTMGFPTLTCWEQLTYSIDTCSSLVIKSTIALWSSVMRLSSRTMTFKRTISWRHLTTTKRSLWSISSMAAGTQYSMISPITWMNSCWTTLTPKAVESHTTLITKLLTWKDNRCWNSIWPKQEENLSWRSLMSKLRNLWFWTTSCGAFGRWLCWQTRRSRAKQYSTIFSQRPEPKWLKHREKSGICEII